MKTKEYKASIAGKSADELNEELVALKREHFNLRMQLATGQLSQVHRMRVVKRNIARVMTAINAPSTAGQVQGS